MKEYRNCTNCGAPLHYDETNYGSVAKCQYCGTEYHIDKLGRIEEYKVSLKFQGKIIDFYISQIEYKPIEVDTYRTLDGTLHTSVSRVPDIELNLISYNMRNIEEEN